VTHWSTNDIGHQVLLQKCALPHKSVSWYETDPCITSVHTNMTIRLKCGTKSEQFIITRHTPLLNNQTSSHKCYVLCYLPVLYNTSALQNLDRLFSSYQSRVSIGTLFYHEKGFLQATLILHSWRGVT